MKKTNAEPTKLNAKKTNKKTHTKLNLINPEFTVV